MEFPAASAALGSELWSLYLCFLGSISPCRFRKCPGRRMGGCDLTRCAVLPSSSQSRAVCHPTPQSRNSAYFATFIVVYGRGVSQSVTVSQPEPTTHLKKPKVVLKVSKTKTQCRILLHFYKLELGFGF